MSALQWTPKLSVGVEALDADHRKLIDMMGRLRQAMDEGRDGEMIGTIIDEMIEYTRYHFATEERLLRMVRYPDLERHQELHAQLVTRVQEFRERLCRRPESFRTLEVYDFLSEWLVRHIIGEDIKDKPYLEAKARPAR